jgi:rare lipoprotein A
MKSRTNKAVFLILVILVLFMIGSGCKRARAPADASANSATKDSPLKCIQRGIASWYGTNMKGKLTASGEKYDPKALTAASRTFPLGTELNVTNLNNDRNVTVTVNDRGPYTGDRIIDMSVAAAHELDMKKSGLAPVCVQNADQGEAQADSAKQ